MALTGQLPAAAMMSSTGAPSGSTTTALSSSSSWNTSGAVSTQSPDPMQRARSTTIATRFSGESSGTPARLSARPPERGPLAGAGPREPDVHVVAVAQGPVDALARAAAPVEADRVAPHALGAGPPRAAVPDQLLHPHAPRQGVRVAGTVGGQQQRDQPACRPPVGRNGRVEVPVHGAALGVEAAALTAQDAP